MGNILTAQNIGAGAAGVGAIGSVLSGVSQYQKGQQEKAAYEYNAAVAIQQMQEQMQTSQEKYQALIGKQASLYGKAGVSLTSGSPLLVMAATAAKGGVEGERIREAGTEEAALQRYYGKMAAFSGTMGGVSSFLSGLSKTGMSMVELKGFSQKASSPKASSPFSWTPTNEGPMG